MMMVIVRSINHALGWFWGDRHVIHCGDNSEKLFLDQPNPIAAVI